MGQITNTAWKNTCGTLAVRLQQLAPLQTRMAPKPSKSNTACWLSSNSSNMPLAMKCHINNGGYLQLRSFTTWSLLRTILDPASCRLPLLYRSGIKVRIRKAELPQRKPGSSWENWSIPTTLQLHLFKSYTICCWDDSLTEVPNSPKTKIINGVLLLVFPSPDGQTLGTWLIACCHLPPGNRGKFAWTAQVYDFGWFGGSGQSKYQWLAATGLSGLSTHGSIIKIQKQK